MSQYQTKCRWCSGWHADLLVHEVSCLMNPQNFRDPVKKDPPPANWITLEEAVQWIQPRLLANGSSFIHSNWDCKYVNVRVDMRTGFAFIMPGNTHEEDSRRSGS